MSDKASTPGAAGSDPPTVTVTFTKPHLSYNIGESAAFAPDMAKQLVADGVAEEGSGKGATGAAAAPAKSAAPAPAGKHS